MPNKVYARLAKYPGIWRVDGVSAVENRGRLGAWAKIHFSGLTEEGALNPFQKASLNGRTLSFRTHTASLFNFSIGSIWQNGALVKREQKCEVFNVDVKQTRLLTLGEPLDVGGTTISTVLPEQYFCFGDKNRLLLSSTLYSISPVNDGGGVRWLVTPAVELLRFYLGASSRVLSAALQGTLGRYVDWERCRLESSKVVLHAHQDLSWDESIVLARAVASASAKHSLLLPHRHLAAINLNNQSKSAGEKQALSIKAGYPFAGTTRLTVRGKRMPLVIGENDVKSQWAMFAMQLVACSHPPDFAGIVVEGTGLIGHSGRTSIGNSKSVHAPVYGTPEGDMDDTPLIDDPADPRLRRLAIHSHSHHFTGFSELQIEGRKIGITNHTQADTGSPSEIVVNALTVAENAHSTDAKGNRGVDQFNNLRAGVSRDLLQFLGLLPHLRLATAGRGWSITTRSLGSGLDQDGEWIARFPKTIGKGHTWHRIKLPSGGAYRRQLVCAEIKHGHAYCYLLEMELKPQDSRQVTILLHATDFAEVGDEAFADLLLLTAVQNGWPHQTSRWKTEKLERCARALFNKIRLFRVKHPHSAHNSRVELKVWSEALLAAIEASVPSL